MRRLIAGAVLLWSCAMATAQPIYFELEALAASIIASPTPAADAAAEIQRIEPLLRQTQSGAESELYRAIFEFLNGFAALGEGQMRRADSHFERAAEGAKRSISRGDTSEAHRVLADSYNQLIEIRPRSYAVFNAGGARRAALRAVELDPTNPLAHLSAAAYLAAAPAIAGGDPSLARYHLDQAQKTSNGSEYQQFLVHVWWGRYYAGRGESSAAASAFRDARGIYPDSWWLDHVMQTVGASS